MKFKTETGVKSFTGLPQFEALPKLKIPHDWFDIYELPHDVFAIYEPYHPQKVFSYLIIGAEKALLLDSGLGIASMQAVVNQLTDKPIILVNSHSHYDHIGCNYEFGTAYLYDYTPAIKILQAGLSNKQALSKLNFGTDVVPDVVYPLEFNSDTYCIPPCKVIPMKQGDTFNLGNRMLRVWHTPGHSPDSVMLQDEKNQILFTGDTLYPGKLYAFSTDSVMGSDVSVYIRSLRRMDEMFHNYTLYCQHCEAIRPGSFLNEAADALEKVITENLPYEIADEGLKRFMFDGFSILRPNDKTI